jgi:phenylacetate-CoA ligase
MNFAAVARRSVYWTLDNARGGQVAAAVADITAILDSPRSPDAVEARRARLTGMLRHAVEHTAFYAGQDAGDLARFPVVDKLTFRTHGPAMLAGGLDASHLHHHRTSGSTGTPFESLWDAGKARRNQADTIAFAGRAGYRLGMPLLYFRLWDGQYRKGRLRTMREALTPIEVRSLDSARAREILLGVRRRRHPITLLGYGSALEELCRVLDSEDLGVGDRVAAVIAVGEAPTEYLRAAVPRHFGRPLVTRYSNTENGIIAQQEPGEREYRVNVAGYALEILRHDSDEPAAPGEVGRIVLTDLFNRAMPFIRYDTGDTGAFAVDEHGGADDTVLASVAGRTLGQLFDTRGRSVNPMTMPEMVAYDLRQFQLVQTGPGQYTLRLNADPDPVRDASIRSKYLAVLGTDADLRIQFVDEVPLLASGKRQSVLNEWRPTR